MTEQYVELHAASAFSFLEGASLPEDLIQRAAELSMPAMALLDRNGVYGAARFHTLARKQGVRAHIGAEIAVSSLGRRLTPPAWLPHQHAPEPARIPLLCASRAGYQNLCQLITRFKMRETTKCEGAATLEDLEEFSSGLVCLTGGEEGPLASALMRGGESEAVKVTRKSGSALWAAKCLCRTSASWRARGRMAKPGCHPYCRAEWGCRYWLPMAFVMQLPMIGKSLTCLPRYGTTLTWNMQAACSP